MKNKKLLFGAIALVAVIAIFAGIYIATRPQTQQGGKHITVTVVHKDGTKKDFPYTTEEEYLGPVLLAEGLVSGDQGEFGLFITTVDGEKADWNLDGSYWALYVGEEMAMQGVDATPITDGGLYKLVYTIGG